MALPKKKQGFRKIVVNEMIFHWRFNSLIEVCPTSCKDNKLFIDFGWFDRLLFINDKSSQSPDYDPQIVTPIFVKEGVEFALRYHWNIRKATGVTKLFYRDKQFKVTL